jgi:hypothetical protein
LKKYMQPWYLFGRRGTNQPRQDPLFCFFRAQYAAGDFTQQTQKSDCGWINHVVRFLISTQGGEQARSPERQQLMHAMWSKRSSNPGV